MSWASESGGRALQQLEDRCAEETQRFFLRQDHDPSPCYALFRRAILERDERAWRFIYAQYGPLVERWVQRHPSFPVTGEEAQYFANRAFERMWSAITPERFDFDELRQLLRYLQMCVHSVVLDHVRASEHAVATAEVELPVALAAPDPAVEAGALGQLERRAFWEEIGARLNSEAERQVVYASFVLGLKPRQIVARYPHWFADVREVYRLKENVLERLRRDEGLKALWGDA